MSEPSQSIGAIFDAAIELPTAQRAAYLDKACGDDDALRQRAEALLRAHESAGTSLEPPAAVQPRLVKTIRLDLPLSERAGDRIGHYKLLQQIGEGGCGVVYMAEQEEPVQRRVALKVIKLGMDTKSVIARFEAERQALALMDHPNIAKVLDAGATETGRPYFVMELVRGIPITDYCDQHNLSTQARLELFMQVCRAVQHAHQKGIIHRDLKPSNILVTHNDGLAMSKVIDFGIAKATQGKLTDHTVFTALEQFIGTPAYMSPEQAEMSALDIDTRSDIYSLGVLLYELLTGKTPFDAKELFKAGLDEMRRHIREQEPAKPSTRLSTMVAADLTTVAGHRQAKPPKLINLVRGDLDWIVMKCLEKDRTRRYDTANGLAMDLQRHLDNEAVFASPPGAGYKIRKFVRRHRAGVLAGSFVVLALVAGIVGTTWGLLDALHQKREAERQARITKHTTDFLTGMFESVDPAEAKLRDITVREIVDQAGTNIGTAFPNDPMTERTIRQTLLDIYRKLGKPDAALNQAEAALRLVESAQGDKDTREKADSLNDFAICLDGAGRSAEALPLHREDLAIAEKVYQSDNTNLAGILDNLATCLGYLGRYSEALPKYEEALAMNQRIHKADDPEVATDLNNLANCLEELSRDDEALGKYDEALAMEQRIHKGDDPEVSIDLNNLAVCLEDSGRKAEALPKFEAALAMKQRIYKEDHPYVALGLLNLANCLVDLGRYDEALTNDEVALAMDRRIYKGDHPNVALVLHNLAGCLADLGRFTEALPNYEEAVAMYERIDKGDNPNVANCLNSCGESLRCLGHFDEALTNYEEALAMDRRLYKGDDPHVVIVLSNYATALDQSGRSVEALPEHEEELAMCRRLYPGDSREQSVSVNNYALCLEHLGRWGLALTNYTAALEMVQRIEKWDDPYKGGFRNHIANCLYVLNRLDDARQQYEVSVALVQRVCTAQPANDYARILLGQARQKLGDVLTEMGRTPEAITNYQAGLQEVETVLATDPANLDAKTLRLTCRIKLGQEKAKVVVSKLSPQSQALAIGLKTGDVLADYNGKPVLCDSDLPVLTGRATGTGIGLDILRNGAPIKFSVNAGPLGVVCEDRVFSGTGRERNP